MIYKRTIEKTILERTTIAPITLVTGARQVGKSQLMSKIEEKYGYTFIALYKPTTE